MRLNVLRLWRLVPRPPCARSGRIVGAAAELGPLGGGAGADARVGGRTCCAKYRAPDVTPPERVRQAQPNNLALRVQNRRF